MSRTSTPATSLQTVLDVVEKLPPQKWGIVQGKVSSLREERRRRLAEQANQELNPDGRFPTTPSGFPIVRVTIEQLKAELQECESKFGMSSEEFYERYLAGEMGDSVEVICWAGAYTGYLDLLVEVEEVEEVENEVEDGA